MTPSNLDLARECLADISVLRAHDGALERGSEVAIFTPDQLDAFAARIRADAMAEYAAMTAKGAKAWADVPDATAWVDELRGNTPATVERKPLTKEQIDSMAEDGVFFGNVYEIALAIEAAHGIVGITAQQGGEHGL